MALADGLMNLNAQLLADEIDRNGVIELLNGDLDSVRVLYGSEVELIIKALEAYQEP